MQISYFDDFYSVKMWLDWTFTITESTLNSMSENGLEGYAGYIITMLPDTIQRLRHAYSKIEDSIGRIYLYF